MNERDMQTMNDQDLVKALREHAEWQRGNEWETPITLGDDLVKAADRIEAQAKEIEKLRAQLRHLYRNCDLDRLEKLAEADKDGRTVVFPCKVGDVVYGFHGEKTILPMVVKWIETCTNGWCIAVQYAPMAPSFYRFSDFGKTVFLTHEEAKKALEART